MGWTLGATTATVQGSAGCTVPSTWAWNYVLVVSWIDNLHPNLYLYLSPSRLGLDAGVLGDLPTSAQEDNSQSSLLAFLSTSISTSDTLTISTSDFPSQYLIPGTVGPGGWGCFFCFFPG